MEESRRKNGFMCYCVNKCKLLVIMLLEIAYISAYITSLSPHVLTDNNVPLP